MKSAGMRGLILTCKHHDCFCLWQTKLTEHPVAASTLRLGIMGYSPRLTAEQFSVINELYC
ncbi:MAG: alpha-L-fucosidase [Oscillospiraceae bacterium]